VPGSPGEWYYYNEDTQETAWSLPTAEVASSSSSSAGRPAEPQAPWILQEAEYSPGTWYYVNTETE
ncbi:unnamed protein product, partial [Polarella glacialis]